MAGRIICILWLLLHQCLIYIHYREYFCLRFQRYPRQCTFIDFCVGASENAEAYASVDVVVFVVFYTDRVTFSAHVTEKAGGRCRSFAGEVECVVGKGDGT